MGRLRTFLQQYGWVLGSIALLAAVYLLPPDTSLAEIRRTGALTACIPTSRPPLVTGDPERPGLEIELLQAIATEIGVRFVPNTIAAMGEDFDPSLWRVTRAQCAVIAGGLLDTAETRGFLDVSPSFAETGWTALTPTAGESLSGRTAAILANVPGADRLALSRFLREQDITIRLMRSSEDVANALLSGEAEIAVTGALYARPLAEQLGYALTPLPPPFEATPIVFGLWKGDLTLKRAIAGAIARIRADGRLDALVEKYLGN